ncbi:hypothetical protein FREDWARD_97 [Mycobacterium phage Fredward]|uniref:hypothetical protein n=1 Tax=Mycobacterium phage Fredward TaxID=1354510 RepID=UPI0003BA155B|nr:hypothetical protein V424_gp017 [Mycobacterium phage Fredward]AGY37038.1 hypothetical protein FREDWARD_97 [Mycobacterium phage Fredward]
MPTIRTQAIFADDLEVGDTFINGEYVATAEHIDTRDRHILVQVVSETLGGMKLRYTVVLRGDDSVIVLHVAGV